MVKKTPNTGIFTFPEKNYEYGLQGTRLEVRITEIFARHYRLELIQVIWATQRYRERDSEIAALPPIAPQEEVEVLTWHEKEFIVTTTGEQVEMTDKRKITIT